MAKNVNFLAVEGKALVEKAIADAVAAAGCEVVEIRYFEEYGKKNVEVLVWKQSGVDLDACEAVHNSVSEALDKYEELFPAEYVLNVSSSGLDRPIVTDDDFRRALGTEIEIIREDKTKSHGTLTAYDEETITILTGKTPKEIKITRNCKVQPYIRF